jgi:hypothetical protein
MTLEQDIRSWLRRYLRNEIPFEAFEDWFVDATWNVQREGNETARALAYTIDRLIADYTSHCRTEGQLKRALRPFAPTWWATPRVRTWTTTIYGAIPADQTVTELQGAGVDRSREAVSG